MANARRVTAWAGAVGAAVLCASAGARAQSSSPHVAPSGKQTKTPDVPAAYRPAPGMCRIWLADVPPNQQPAPTDCASAVRNRPSNGRVLFGDDYVGKKTSALRSTQSWATNPTSPRPNAAAGWRLIPAVVRSGGTPERVGTAPHARAAQDDYEAGYAAGYRDAMNGRRPRFRGVDRLDPGTGFTRGNSSGTGYGTTYGTTQGPSQGSAVVVVPPGQDPRYFNNGRYPPPGRANGVCLDRDGDGWCDDPRFGAPVCRDLDGDGRCDDYPALAAAPYPSSLPEMRAGVDVVQGRGSATALRWLGTAEVVARVIDPKRSGTPYRVLWFDANTNALLQTWTDLDGDGIADRVEVFRNGRRVKLLGR